MFKKKLEVVEINKKEDKIVLKENQSPVLSFWLRHRGLIFATLLILSLTILILGVFLTVKNIYSSYEPIIKNVSIDTNLTEFTSNISTGNRPISEEYAKDSFLKTAKFKKDGEILVVKTVETSRYIIRFFSDGTAIYQTTQSNTITRVDSLEDGSYGIDKFGVFNTKAEISDIKVKDTKTYPWGEVIYYSDGSAEIFGSDMNMFVRNAKEINENYISDNKVTYLKETKEIGNTKLNYYHDGTIEVIINKKSYLVRTEKDLEIKNNSVKFKNNNEAAIAKTKTLSDGTTIDYYEDGGAIIRDGNKTLSVRKSNSIIIKDNKIYEIIDNIYVEEIHKTKDGLVTYYTNGGAVANYNGKTVYVKENSNIKFRPNGKTITQIEETPENLTEERNINDENVKLFEETAVVKTKNYIAIIPKENVVFNTDGTIKDITIEGTIDDENTFTITNNTNSKLKYRITIEKSKRTTLDEQYIRYQLLTKTEYIEPTNLNDNLWTKDKLANGLNVNGIHYILLDGELEAHDSTDVKLMLWTDYDTIPNSMQNKYFYGTIRVYAWVEE